MRLAAAGLCLALGSLAAHAESLDAYKADVARRIHRASHGETFDEPAPPLLKSIVVLAITVDARGRAHAKVVRSNGFRSLEAKALRSVRRASPLPRWSGAGGRPVHYYETWLFRRDGRFQVRSIAPPQVSS